jgi:hypothetical protein
VVFLAHTGVIVGSCFEYLFNYYVVQVVISLILVFFFKFTNSQRNSNSISNIYINFDDELLISTTIFGGKFNAYKMQHEDQQIGLIS